MTLARVIARIARGEIEFLFGRFKMASKFFSFDLAYLLNGYFAVINSSTVKTKNLKDAQGKLQKSQLIRHDSHKKAPKLLRCPPRCVVCR